MNDQLSQYLLLTSAICFLCSCTGITEPESIKEAAKLANCQVVKFSSATNIFNGTSAECADASYVYWFPTPEANTNHGKLCANFGGKKVDGGATWTRYKPSC